MGDLSLFTPEAIVLIGAFVLFAQLIFGAGRTLLWWTSMLFSVAGLVASIMFLDARGEEHERSTANRGLRKFVDSSSDLRLAARAFHEIAGRHAQSMMQERSSFFSCICAEAGPFDVQRRLKSMLYASE